MCNYFKIISETFRKCSKKYYFSGTNNKNMLTPTIEIYKGYEIRTTPNADAFTSLIYKGNDVKGGTFATPLDKQTSVQKAKNKIDNYEKN